MQHHIPKAHSSTPADYTLLVDSNEVKQFCVRCVEKAGATKAHSIQLAEVLVAGDFRGHYSHGLNRIEMYVNDILKGVCETKGDPVLLKESESTALIDGRNLLGPVVGNFAMKTAIEKAKKTGTAWVAACGSNHYGIAGWYSMQAAENGLIGMSFTNTSPLVFPTRARNLAVGTNPITVAAPTADPKDPFVLDMATSAVALGKIEMCRRRGVPIPEGWGGDSTGKPTTDATEAATTGGLFPLGGAEHTSGYKGYGLGMMVEMFCGILADAAYGPNIRRWMNTTRPANLGQGFVAIDPSAFASGFQERMSDYVKIMRGLERADPELPVLVPGDPERAHIAECEENGGILYPPVLLESLHKLADRLQVERLPVIRNL